MTSAERNEGLTHDHTHPQKRCASPNDNNTDISLTHERYITSVFRVPCVAIAPQAHFCHATRRSICTLLPITNATQRRVLEHDDMMADIYCDGLCRPSCCCISEVPYLINLDGGITVRAPAITCAELVYTMPHLSNGSSLLTTPKVLFSLCWRIFGQAVPAVLSAWRRAGAMMLVST